MVDASALVPLWKRPFVAGDSLAFYMVKLVAPLRLAMDYGRQPNLVLTHWWAYGDWILPAALLGVGTAARKRMPWLLCGILIFLINFLPVLGLSPNPFQNYSTVADRYAYMSLTGIALIIAFWISTTSKPKTAQTVTIAVLAVMLVLTEFQLGYWQNSVRLFNHEIAINPASRAVYDNYGQVELSIGNIPLAAYYFQKAIDTAPDLPGGYYGLAHIDAEKGETTAAISLYNGALRQSIHFDLAHLELGDEYSKIGDYKDAVEQYQELAADTPHIPMVHAKMAAALAKLGDDTHALSEYSLCATLDPTSPAYPEAAGKIMLKDGNDTGALQAFEDEERLQPNSAESLFNVGAALLSAKRFAEAAKMFRKCVAVDPNLASGHEDLGVALAATGNMNGAAAELTKASMLAPSNAAFRANMGRILAINEAGKRSTQ